MAKSSKVEDYWREHNVENLFKELTQILVRRMPSDPAIAIVEHLHKKYPKSFKNDESFSKMPRQSVISLQSDIQNESLMDQRSSNQSQVSGVVTIPSMNSAFTDLLKQNTATTTSQSKPGLIFKHLVFANQIGQQVVKLRKYIRSDREILDEEVIKPVDTKPTAAAAEQTMSEDLQNMETHDEPTVLQLIKYKQQIHAAKDRRQHQEKLAELANQQREKEQLIQSDIAIKSAEIQREDSTVSKPISNQTRKSSHKPIIKSTEEEILNDENVFQPQKQRERTRQKTSRFNSCRRLTIKPNQENLTCKFCGHVLNKDEQQLPAHPTAPVYQPQPSTQSIETTNSAGIDDWFESASDVSVSQQANPWVTNDVTPPPTGSSTFRRSLFQPTNDTVEHRTSIRPIVDSDEKETTNKRTITPRLSETGLFSRSPASKKHQTSD